MGFLSPRRQKNVKEVLSNVDAGDAAAPIAGGAPAVAATCRCRGDMHDSFSSHGPVTPSAQYNVARGCYPQRNANGQVGRPLDKTEQVTVDNYLTC